MDETIAETIRRLGADLAEAQLRCDLLLHQLTYLKNQAIREMLEELDVMPAAKSSAASMPTPLSE